MHKIRNRRISAKNLELFIYFFFDENKFELKKIKFSYVHPNIMFRFFSLT